MGKIFLVNTIPDCAINEAGIWQWQEHAVPLTSPVWHLCWWAEATFLKDVPPAGIKDNQCRGKPSRKDFNCDFLYLSFIFSQCKKVQDLLLWFVRWALGLYWDIHPFLDVLIYLLIQFWHTFKGCLWKHWWGWVFFAQRFTATGILWQKQWGGHVSAGECVSVATRSHTRSVAGPGLQLGLGQGKENKVQSILEVGK